MMVKIKFVLRARVLAFPVGRLQLNSVVVVCVCVSDCTFAFRGGVFESCWII